MNGTSTQHWLDRLGYNAPSAVLHRRGGQVPERHPYALEINALLCPDGPIRAQAVFDVEGMPTVVFVGDDDAPLSPRQLDEARKRIWNQNLATVVIDVRNADAMALPARRLPRAGKRLRLDEARPDGPFSAQDVASANIWRRVPEWFDAGARVDRKLLANLTATVSRLATGGFAPAADDSNRRRLAELLMGQVLFVSYLEHRDIVDTWYGSHRNVRSLHDLIAAADREGLWTLIDALRSDFNGDFLDDDSHDPWSALTDDGFHLVSEFLRRTDMSTGQRDFWNYDFSYIPVELLSGLYESLLSARQQASEGAYYTPRHLAMLVVDQAFACSNDPLAETVFDGACGSGILLTTAYRRLIALAEARAGCQLRFSERAGLLRRCIFGGDINVMACRVTAFSLYLSLLEGLSPTDIRRALDDGGARLPLLQGSNLAYGEETGDFFRDTHAFRDRRFSLVLSNPPWVEPKATTTTSADAWAQSADAPFARRQIAGAFSLRAIDYLAPDGRICVILPIAQVLAPTSAAFVAHLLDRYQPVRLINFGDLQGLLFPSTENTCHVFLAEVRPMQDPGAGPADEAPRSHGPPPNETFEYCVPKADISLALGRLAMQSADKHRLQTRSVAEDPRLLVTLMWGDPNDLAIWTRLAARGRIADFLAGPAETRRWSCRKGIHPNDETRDQVSAEPLQAMRFVPVPALQAESPVLHPDRLTDWPERHRTVVGLNDSVRAVFDGPRVLFPDGFSRTQLNVRSAYFDGPAAFTHSIGVIAGKPEDAELLQFVAIYLRSSLARYFLMMRGWKMLCERNGVHLVDVKPFPFFEPRDAPSPEAAAAALADVTKWVGTITELEADEQPVRYAECKSAFDEAVFRYFGLTADEQVLVRETVELLMPSIRPRAFKSLDTPVQHKARREDLSAYARALAASLTSWRDRTGGSGRFVVSVMASDPGRDGLSGIVRIRYRTEPTGTPCVDTTIDDELVLETLDQLRRSELRAVQFASSLTLVPDAHIWLDQSLHLVRPLIRRGWTFRQALRDAEQIVRAAQSLDTPRKRGAPA